MIHTIVSGGLSFKLSKLVADERDVHADAGCKNMNETQQLTSSLAYSAAKIK